MVSSPEAYDRCIAEISFFNTIRRGGYLLKNSSLKYLTQTQHTHTATNDVCGVYVESYDGTKLYNFNYIYKLEGIHIRIINFSI